MSDPRPVELTLAGIRSLTVLESARALALAGVRQSEAQPILVALAAGNASPELVEKATTLLYAYAFQLELRTDRRLSWLEAQGWRLILGLEERDELADAEAEASVAAAAQTGLTPAEAGELTLAQLEHYRAAAAAQERAIRGARRGRRAG